MIKNLTINRNRNNTNGVFSIEDRKFFYKLLSISDYKKEMNGYEVIKNVYPVANLIFNGVVNNKNGLLLYEYEESINKNCGLLVDLFANNNSYSKDSYLFDRILLLYKNSFQGSFKVVKSKTSDIFFKDRIKSRLDIYYNKKFFEEVENISFDFCDYKISNINFEKIVTSLRKFFNNRKEEHCVISQCDPNDLNIGTKPIVLDYLAGGYNPFMAEFAVFFWYCIAQGNYFSIVYNKNEYVNHPSIIRKIDKVTFRKNTLIHHINHKRKEFLVNYIEKVVSPLLKKARADYNWYEDFKNYLVMRIISVFDISKMKYEDKLLSLAYLDIFYNRLNVRKISQLVKIINEL